MNIRGSTLSLRLQYNVVRFNLYMWLSQKWRQFVDLVLGPVETHYLTNEGVTTSIETIWGVLYLTRSVKIVGRPRSLIPRRRIRGYIVTNPPAGIRCILPSSNWFPGDTSSRVRDQMHLQKRAFDQLTRSFNELEEWTRCSRQQPMQQRR